MEKASTISNVLKAAEVRCQLLDLSSLADRRTFLLAQWCTVISDVSAAMVDVAIAGSLAHLLHRGRGGFTAYDGPCLG